MVHQQKTPVEPTIWGFFVATDGTSSHVVDHHFPIFLSANIHEGFQSQSIERGPIRGPDFCPSREQRLMTYAGVASCTELLRGHRMATC